MSEILPQTSPMSTDQADQIWVEAYAYGRRLIARCKEEHAGRKIGYPGVLGHAIALVALAKAARLEPTSIHTLIDAVWKRVEVP